MPKPEGQNEMDELERLYSERDEQDIAHIDHTPRRGGWRRLIVGGFFLALFASGLAWLGFYFFTNSLGQNAGDIKLELVAPETAIVGDTVTYRIRLVNTVEQSAESVRVRVNYPEGFVWNAASEQPEGEAHNTWRIEQLAPGETKEIRVDGLLLGEPGGVRTFFATMTYRMANFRSELQASASVSTRLDASLLRLELAGPKQLSPGSPATYTVNYTYDGESPLPPAQLVMSIPTGLSIVSTTPSVEGDGVHWPVPALTKGAKGDFTVMGTWAAEASGDQELRAAIQTTIDGLEYPIVTATTTTSLNSGDVVMALAANGSESPSAVALGDTIHWTLTIENKGDRVMRDIEARVRFDSPIVDWGRVDLPDGAVAADQGILWSSATTPLLEAVPAEGKVTLRFVTPLTVRATSAASWSLGATPSLTHHKLDDEAVDRTYDGALVTVPISTPLVLDVEARYFDEQGAPIGTGPLPPKANAPTTYRIEWTLSGAIHSLRDVIVRANLPANVRAVAGTGSASVGAVSLNDAGTPEWRLTTLESGLQPSATFMVTLTPAAADVGRIVVLSGRTTATATDSVTRGAVTTSGSTATTNLDSDAIARGKGVVEK